MKSDSRTMSVSICLSGAVGLVACLALFAMPAAAQAPGGIPGVLAPGVQAELVQEGFTFIEGPVGTADGGLFFSDIRVSKTYRMNPQGAITVIRENTKSTNGLALSPTGDLLGAEGEGGRISKRSAEGTITTLSGGYQGKPLLAPNDLIMDSKGGIYFTDPGPRPVVQGRPTYVFYLPSGAKDPILVDGSIARPNGLVLTRDEKTLIVDDTIGPTVFAFDIQPGGTLRNKRVFAQLRDTKPGEESGADGSCIDRDDRVYVTTASGVQVFDRTGSYLGTIRAGRQAANCAFAGPDKKTLYLTAREGLYRIRTIAQGPDRLGK
jgi:gluconolactonase